MTSCFHGRITDPPLENWVQRKSTAPRTKLGTATSRIPAEVYMTHNDAGDYQTPDDSDAQYNQDTIDALLEECRQLRETVERQQATIEAQQETITDQVSTINDLQDRVEALEASSEKTRDIARTAIAKTEQLAAEQEDDETLPEGVEPSTSPLDFFANCRESKLRETFVEDSNRANTFRAIAVAKRWPEFAQKRTDGEAVFFTRELLDTALTAHLGEKPHRQTVSRVWDSLADLGGGDLVEKRHCVSATQEPTELLVMDTETAEGLLDGRYLGLDLLETTGTNARTGGVTPVVTGATG